MKFLAHPFILFPIGILLLGLSILWAVSVGTVRIPITDVASIVVGHDQDIPEAWKDIVRFIRLPRVLAAGMIGGFLALGGVNCQGLFRNPLSEPYLLGMSSGAALGAALAIVFGYDIALLSFIGALTVAGTVFIAAGRGAFKLPSTLLLTGIAIAFLCQSSIWLLMSFHRDDVERITFWTLGSLSSITWEKTAILATVTLPVTIFLIAFGRVLDVLSMGYDSAYSLGLNPQKTAIIILSLTALGTASAVAAAGSIGFVGLVVPHIMRILGGPSHRGLALSSWLGGGILLILADMVARTINAPGELPVGVVTSLLGAPFLLVLASKKRKGRLDG